MTLVPLLVLSAWQAASGQAPAEKWEPAYPKLFNRTTGANGFEDYVRAADIASNPEASSFVSYEIYLADLARGEKRDQVVQPPKGIGDSWSLLDVQREHVRRTAMALDLVDRGNAKNVFDPRQDLNAATIYPELAELRALAKLGLTACRVSFADGQPDRAVSISISLMTMRQKLPKRSLIDELVGVSIDAMVLANISDNSQRISERGWKQLESFVNQRLQENTYKAAMAGELNFVLSALAEMRRSPEAFGALLASDDYERITKTNANLTPSDRDKLIARTTQKVQSVFTDLLQQLDGPERTWVQDLTAKHSDGQDASLEGLATSIVETFTPAYGSGGEVAVRIRTQLRLLKLHALVQSYLWNNEVLPEKLEQAAPKDYIDPLTDAPYIYEPHGKDYKLASKGLPQTGEIQLRYKRQPGTSTGPADPLPLLNQLRLQP